MDDGFWLIDAVEHPINKESRSTRKRAVEEATDRLVQRCMKLAPKVGVIICHGLVYEAAGLVRGRSKSPHPWTGGHLA